MKYLYNKSKYRKVDGDRYSFAFFAVGAVVVLATVFIIGLQVGRMIEKDAATSEVRQGRGTGARQAGTGSQPRSAATDVGKDLGAFSEDAGKIPVVPPPNARDAAGEVEKRLTFQETLPRKESGPVALVQAVKKDNVAVPGGAEGGRKKFVVQAGTFRDKGKAESFRKRLADAGYAVRLSKGTGKNRESLYRVLIGPFADRESARKAVENLKREMQVESYLLPERAG